MKSSTSTLNPYAASYIPLAEREVKNEGEGNKALPRDGSASDDCAAAGDLKMKAQQIDYPCDSASQSPHQMESKFSVEESEIDLAYLQMIFPSVSEQSLLDVYNVNGGDLEAAIDMLNHLESADNLLDTFVVEDAQKSIPSAECLSVKGIKVTGESSTSSGSSDLAVAS